MRGIYMPRNREEWTAFLTKHGLALDPPSIAWNAIGERWPKRQARRIRMSRKKRSWWA